MFLCAFALSHSVIIHFLKRIPTKSGRNAIELSLFASFAHWELFECVRDCSETRFRPVRSSADGTSTVRLIGHRFGGTMSLFSCFGRKRSSNHRYEDYVDFIDLNNSDLIDVPLQIFLYERSLEKLLLSSNHVSAFLLRS